MTDREFNTRREQLFDDIRAAGSKGLLVERTRELTALESQNRISVKGNKARAINDLDIPPLKARRALFPEIYS